MLRAPAICMLTLLALGCSDLVAARLTLVVGGRKKSVDYRLNEGHRFLQLSDLARALKLELRIIDRSTVRVEGPRGSLQLRAGRPLVRGGYEDVLLQAPVRLEGRSDWWVPFDFLTRGLPSILEHRLIEKAQDTWEAHLLERQQVRVNIRNFADHVTLTFSSHFPFEPQIREFSDRLEVRFRDLLVDPQVTGVRPRHELVKRLEFGEQNQYGAFDVAKGTRYGFFRSSHDGAARLRLDVYLAGSGKSRSGAVSSAVPGRARTPLLPRNPRAAERLLPTIVDVVIDPLPGKQSRLSLELARSVARHLRERGVRVELTRRRDVTLSPDARSALGNQPGTRAFVGLGVVQSTGMNGSSTQAYVYGDPFQAEEISHRRRAELSRWGEGHLGQRLKSWRLALSLQQQLNRIQQSDGRPIEAPVAVLKGVQAPAVLIEVRLGSDALSSELRGPKLAELIAIGLEPVLR